MDIRIESHIFDLLVVIHIWPTHGWVTGRVKWRVTLIYSYFLVSDKLGFVLKMIGLRPDQSFCIETAQFQSKAAIGLPDGISKKAAIELAK